MRLIDRESYTRAERRCFFLAATSALALPILYLWFRSWLLSFGECYGPLVHAFVFSGWLAALMLASVPAALGASLLFARRIHRLTCVAIALALALAVPVVGWIAAHCSACAPL